MPNRIMRDWATMGMDLITGTDPFTPRRGYIYVFIPQEGGAKIQSFKEIPVETLNGEWLIDPDIEPVLVEERSYIGVDLDCNMSVHFDGPVTEITLASGSGWVAYLK